VRQAFQHRPWPRFIPTSLALGLVVCASVYWRFVDLSPGRAKPVASAGQVSSSAFAAETSSEPALWGDSFGDGFPACTRLDRAADRESFARWMTFLAEAAYYHPAPPATEEVQDCAALVRYAYRNALAAHTPAWHREARLSFEPGFGDVSKYAYPRWPLGRRLFRTRPGPFSGSDLENDAFAEFADARTLLLYNTFPVSRDVQAARPGDLLFFHQPDQTEPFHVILFVGRSHFQPQGADWIVYHTGDLEGRRGEVRHLQAALLMQHPDPRWRPLASNSRFLGVYRLDLLR